MQFPVGLLALPPVDIPGEGILGVHRVERDPSFLLQHLTNVVQFSLLVRNLYSGKIQVFVVK
jgi:hypothetical protein